MRLVLVVNIEPDGDTHTEVQNRAADALERAATLVRAGKRGSVYDANGNDIVARVLTVRNEHTRYAAHMVNTAFYHESRRRSK